MQLADLPIKQTFATVAAFVAGYGICMIAEGHTNSIVFSWMALIQGFVSSGLYHGGLVQGNGNGNGVH